MRKLYIVATPIGNLQDITLRALEILKSVEVILCEDTRQTGKLLARFEFENKLASLHQHSTPEKIQSLLSKYNEIAYVSDAGTPGISDPGGQVAATALAMGFDVIPIPGACAVIAALSVSGFPTDKFLFLGFMPHKSRNKFFDLINQAQYTVCFYESPHRIIKTMEQLKEKLPADQQLMVGRELTKKFETIYRGAAADIGSQIKPKGEFVIVVAPKAKALINL